MRKLNIEEWKSSHSKSPWTGRGVEGFDCAGSKPDPDQKKAHVLQKRNGTIAPFKIIEISVPATKEKGQSMVGPGKLWDNCISKNKERYFCIYTNSDYESDFTGEYSAIIGCQVHSLENIPDGLVGL